MTAQINILPTNLSRLTRDNLYNPYNLEAKARFSQIFTREFSQALVAILKGAAPSEFGVKGLALKSVAVKGGEFSC